MWDNYTFFFFRNKHTHTQGRGKGVLKIFFLILNILTDWFYIFILSGFFLIISLTILTLYILCIYTFIYFNSVYYYYILIEPH